jgi:hypothetical protein
MAMECLSGQIIENMKGSIKTIGKVDMGLSDGLMDGAIKDNGRMEGNMEKVILKLQGRKVERVFGKTENGLIGYIR